MRVRRGRAGQVPRLQRDHPCHPLRKLWRSLHHPNRPSLRSGRHRRAPPHRLWPSRGIPPNRRSRPSRRSGCYHHHRHQYRRSPRGGLGRYRRNRRHRPTRHRNRRLRPDHRRTRELTGMKGKLVPSEPAPPPPPPLPPHRLPTPPFPPRPPVSTVRVSGRRPAEFGWNGDFGERSATVPMPLPPVPPPPPIRPSPPSPPLGVGWGLRRCGGQ